MTEQLPSEVQDLHAYADGQLSPEARRQVEASLIANKEAQKQVDDYTAIRQGLKNLYDPVVQEPVPGSLRKKHHRWWRPVGTIAAGVFLLVTGTWIGVHLQPTALFELADAPHVVREAAMAYAVYTPEVRHPVEVPGDQEKHLVAWLTKRMGADVRAPNLAALGFNLIGGRLLSSDDGPGALFMYEDEEGKRIVLYVCQNERQGANTAFRFAHHDQVSVFYWFDGPFSYALAGELDRPTLLALVKAAYQQVVI